MGITAAAFDRFKARFEELGREGMAIDERCARADPDLTQAGVLAEWQTLQNKFRNLRDEGEVHGLGIDFKEPIGSIQQKIDYLKTWEGE